MRAAGLKTMVTMLDRDLPRAPATLHHSPHAEKAMRRQHHVNNISSVSQFCLS